MTPEQRTAMEQAKAALEEAQRLNRDVPNSLNETGFQIANALASLTTALTTPATPDAAGTMKAAPVGEARKLVHDLLWNLNYCRASKEYQGGRLFDPAVEKLIARADRFLATPDALSAAPQAAMQQVLEESGPVAWARGVCTPRGEHGPAEYDVEFCAGDNPPENNGEWQPLYRHPSKLILNDQIQKLFQEIETHYEFVDRSDLDGPLATTPRWLALKESVSALIGTPQAAGVVPDNCDGKEQEAFETWAKDQGLNMRQHPLHYLFLDKQTSIARRSWSAAITYCRNTILPAPPQPGAGEKGE